MIRGRKVLYLPDAPKPTFTLGPILGPIANIVSRSYEATRSLADPQIGITFTIFTTVFFLFPPDLPVTGNNMNYAVVVLGIVSK